MRRPNNNMGGPTVLGRTLCNSPGMSGNAHVETRAGSGRRVVLIPASPGSTPQSVQDLQPFAVLADDDEDLDGGSTRASFHGQWREDCETKQGIRSEVHQETVGVKRRHREDRCRPSSTRSTCQSHRNGRPGRVPSDADSDNDRVAISDGGSETLEELLEPADPIPFDFPRRNLHAGFTVLDGVSLPEIFCEAGCGHAKCPEMFPRCTRSPREHPRDFGWQGIWKHSAGSVRVEVVFLATQVVVIQAFEGRSGVEEEVA